MKRTEMRFIFLEESYWWNSKKLVLGLMFFKYFIRDLAQVLMW